MAFFSWLFRLPFLLILSTIIVLIILILYIFLEAIYGDDLMHRFIDYEKNKKEVYKTQEELFDTRKQLKSKIIFLDSQEKKLNNQISEYTKLKKKLKKLVDTWQHMTSNTLIPNEEQQFAIKIMEKEVQARASRDGFYKSIKDITKDFNLNTPNNVEEVRNLINLHFIDTDNQALALNIYDLLIFNHLNCFVAAWLLYGTLHSSTKV